MKKFLKIVKEFVKNNFWEILLIAIIALLLFTPLKSHLKRIFALATEVKTETQKTAVLLESWNINLSGINTADISLNEAKGKVIVLQFWATWCPDCRLEMPTIQALYNRNLSNTEFILVALERDNQTDKLQKFIDETQLSVPVFVPQSNLTSQLEPEQFPTTYIIDKQGNIVTKKIGATDWNADKIVELLKKLSK